MPTTDTFTENYFRYYVTVSDHAEREVSKDEYIKAERMIGLKSRFGINHTHSNQFSGVTEQGVLIIGRVETLSNFKI